MLLLLQRCTNYDFTTQFDAMTTQKIKKKKKELVTAFSWGAVTLLVCGSNIV